VRCGAARLRAAAPPAAAGSAPRGAVATGLGGLPAGCAPEDLARRFVPGAA